MDPVAPSLYWSQGFLLGQAIREFEFLVHWKIVVDSAVISHWSRGYFYYVKQFRVLGQLEKTSARFQVCSLEYNAGAWRPRGSCWGNSQARQCWNLKRSAGHVTAKMMHHHSLCALHAELFNHWMRVWISSSSFPCKALQPPGANLLLDLLLTNTWLHVSSELALREQQF